MCWMKSQRVTIHVKTVDRYFDLLPVRVVVFVMLYKVVPKFECERIQTVKCDHSSESC